jgi:hypothetical protein
LPLKLPGLVESGKATVEAVAFEAKAIHLPFWLITGRLLTMSILMLSWVGDPKVFFSTDLVSVIW